MRNLETGPDSTLPVNPPAPRELSVSTIYQAYLVLLLAGALVLGVVYFSPIGSSLRSLGTLTVLLGCLGAISWLGFRHHQLHSALATSESMYRTLTRMVPVGIFTTDQSGHCIFVNPRYCDISGQTIDTAKGLGWRDVVHPDDRSRVDQSWTDLLEKGIALAAEYRLVRDDAAIVWVHAQARRQTNAVDEHVGYVCATTDITANKAFEQKIQQMAFFDALTGLPNRRLLLDRLQQAVTGINRKGNSGALLFLDLDNFKMLNDTMGHHKGDLLLQQVAQRLKSCVREDDTVARLGGDEFVAVLDNLSPVSQIAARQAEAVAEKILHKLNMAYTLDTIEHNCTTSIGITLFDAVTDQVDDLMKRADMAMYQAKAAGRNTLRFFDPEMQAVVAARSALEADLRTGLQQQQFLLHYQPQVDGTGAISGAEAFVRWLHPTRGMVSPSTFIPLAEETGLIIPLGHWVLEAACQQLSDWKHNPKTAQLTMSVKISGHQFRQSDFVDEVLDLLQTTGARADLLKLELNENLLVADVEDIIAKTTALTERGLGFSLADLGTGYSSLSHLKRLSLEQLRIDQSFVRGLLTNSNDAAVTKSIFALADSLGLVVSAEGIETQEQLDALADQGCQVYQGYLFSQPLRLAAFEDLLTHQ